MKQQKPFVSTEQQEENRVRLEAWKSQLPKMMSDYRKWSRHIEGSRRAIGAMLDTLDLIFGNMADQFTVDADAAVLPMPSTLKLKAAAIPGQRMSIIGRLEEAARLGIIELWTEEEADFKGRKIVVPLNTEEAEFYSLFAQGARYEGVTAHSRRGAQSEILYPNLPACNTTKAGRLGYKNSLGRIRRSLHAGTFVIVSIHPEGVSAAEIAAMTGVKRNAAHKRLKALLEAELVHKTGKKYSPLTSPCAFFKARQSNADQDAGLQSSIRHALEHTLDFRRDLAEKLRRKFPPTQSDVVKNERRIRALEGMLAAGAAGEPASRYVLRRYT